MKSIHQKRLEALERAQAAIYRISRFKTPHSVGSTRSTKGLETQVRDLKRKLNLN